jgi:hypothetical protein
MDSMWTHPVVSIGGVQEHPFFVVDQFRIEIRVRRLAHQSARTAS